MTGILFLNGDRPDILFPTGALYGGLHCGTCFACYLENQWRAVRLEYTTDWILVMDGVVCPVCYGTSVCI